MIKEYIDNKPVIETRHLILREYRPCDIKSLKKWLGDDELYLYWGRGPLEIEKNPELIFFDEGWPRGNGDVPDLRLVIILKEKNAAIGEIQIYDSILKENHEDRPYSVAEVGYRLSPDYRGRGFAAEALRSFSDFIFSNTEIEILHTRIAAENIKSENVLLRSGFRNDGMVYHGLMIDQICDYKEYELSKEIFRRSYIRECENSYLGLLLWSAHFCITDKGKGLFYSKLKGCYYLVDKYVTDLKESIGMLLDDGKKFKIIRVSETSKEFIEKAYPGAFIFEEDPASADYLYEIEDLAFLEGRKYSNKRNQLKRFFEDCKGDWYIEPLSDENYSECISFCESWYERKLPILKNTSIDLYDSLKDESAALPEVMDRCIAGVSDKFECVLIKAEGKPVAFAVAEKLCDDTLDIVVEKADDSVTGSYVAVCSQFARYIMKKHPEIRYISRENDMGNPGLRQAKKSYHPVKMLKKYTVTKV